MGQRGRAIGKGRCHRDRGHAMKGDAIGQGECGERRCYWTEGRCEGRRGTRDTCDWDKGECEVDQKVKR